MRALKVLFMMLKDNTRIICVANYPALQNHSKLNLGKPLREMNLLAHQVPPEGQTTYLVAHHDAIYKKNCKGMYMYILGVKIKLFYYY